MTSRPLQFGPHSHRCLFCNDCVQAHLVGLDSANPEYGDCLAEPVTLIVTFGSVRVETPSASTIITEGTSCPVPQGVPFHARTEETADLMIIVQPSKCAA